MLDGLSLSLPEWESAVEKPRKRKERLRKYQLQGEKLAKTCVVLLFGLYLATSSVAGDRLGAVQECSLRAPFGRQRRCLYALCSKRGQRRKGTK